MAMSLRPFKTLAQTPPKGRRDFTRSRELVTKTIDPCFSSLLYVSADARAMVISPGLCSVPVPNPSHCRSKMRVDGLVDDPFILSNDSGVLMDPVDVCPGMHPFKPVVEVCLK